MPDTAKRAFSAGFVSEALWEEPWAVWPPPVRRPPRLPLRPPLRQFVIVRCLGIGKSGGIRISVITNGCGFLCTLKVFHADKVHLRAGGKCHAPACNLPSGKSPLEIALSQTPNEDLGLNCCTIGNNPKNKSSGRSPRFPRKNLSSARIYRLHLQSVEISQL